MGLFLSVISYQQLSSSLQTKFTLVGAAAVIGRSDRSDWILPDSENIVSSRHAELTSVMDKYYITDVSTNGVFINQETKPLGKGNRHALASGDQISLGEYVLEVKILAGVNKTNLSDPFLAGSEMQDSFVLDSQFIPDDWNWENEDNHPQKQQTQIKSDLISKATTQTSQVKPKSDASKYNANVQIDPNRGTVDRVSSSQAQSTLEGSDAGVKHLDNMQALLSGLGIDESPASDDKEWWFDLGASMRTINEELMSSLRDRAAFKNQFRVNHTMFQVKENNPFKFSASVDDLFRNLYLRSNGSFMSTNKAITEAFGDLRSHEQSMRAGLEGAVVGVLEQLSPDNMREQQADKSVFDKFKRNNKEQKMWRRFIELHADIRNEITINRENILSDAFVKAYEDKQKQG